MAEDRAIAELQAAWNRTFLPQGTVTSPFGYYERYKRAQREELGAQITRVTYLGNDALNNPMYKLVVVYPDGRVDTVNYALVSGRLVEATLSKGARDNPIQERVRLIQTQDKWLKFLADGHSQNADSAAELTNFIQSWKGTASALDSIMQAELGIGVLSIGKVGIMDADTSGVDLPGDGGGGNAPVYVAPDRRVIEDYVKGSMVSLVGTVLDSRVQEITDLYMSDHRRNFDTPDVEIDPGQSVVEAIRQSSEYRTIHQNRPESADERTWISDRRQAALQGGLDIEEQEDFAIVQATAAGDVADVREAAAFSQLSLSGQAPDFLDRFIGTVANNMFRGVKR